jgi:DNA-binding LacI/PurR family transcriptional regulator
VRPVTLRDVAQVAGVSMKTVSNVVHGVGGKVSEETAERVRQVITELGYRPNLSARRLRSGRTQVIALAVPDLANAYFAELAAATIKAARSYGYNVFIEETGDSPEAELRASAGLDDPMIDGVILAPLLLPQRELVGRDPRVPLVLLGERQYDFPCDQVCFDNVEASRRITAHLIDRGYRRIAVLGRQDDLPHATAEQRLEGYRRALDEGGLAARPELEPPLPAAVYSRPTGAAVMARLLSQAAPPDAVYCFADVLAFGAMSAAHRAGLTIPGDLAIAGFDGVEESRYRTPTLTTIAPDLNQMAQLAVSALIERIKASEPIGHRRILCDFELLIGESTSSPVAAPGPAG